MTKSNEKMVSVKTVRRMIADYMRTEGCDYCQDIDGHKVAKERLTKLLNVSMYDDESGYDFRRFRSKERPQ
jgi:hypothetical protein